MAAILFLQPFQIHLDLLLDLQFWLRTHEQPFRDRSVEMQQIHTDQKTSDVNHSNLNPGVFSCELQILVCSTKSVFFSLEFTSRGRECEKILSGTISLHGWIFSMSDGVIVLAIFTCQPPRPKNTRASPSCSNSSQRRFMTLCCRPTSHRFGVQPTCCNFC